MAYCVVTKIVNVVVVGPSGFSGSMEQSISVA